MTDNEEALDRAKLINNLGELVDNLEADVERVEYYRDRLRDGDPADEILEEFRFDDEFFID